MPEERPVSVDSDWLDSVIAEFGFFSKFPRLSTSFLREKAERQLRDRAGRWQQERAHLDAPDSEVHPFHLPTHDRPASVAAPTGTSGKIQATKIQPGRVMKVLRDAGFDSLDSRRWNSRGAVFQVQHGGQNPAFVFVVDKSAATTARMEPLAEKYEKARQSLELAKQAMEKAEKSGADFMKMKRLKMDLDEKKTAHFVAKRNLNNGEAKWVAAHGHTPEATSEEAAQRLADDAGTYLAKALEGAPQWFKDRNNGIMVEFDESLLIPNDQNTELSTGQAKLGGKRIVMHRGAFYTATSYSKDPNWYIHTAANTNGEYALPHEVGHLTDSSDLNSPWSSLANEDIWRAAVRAGLMSTYGATAAPEGYAEAFALWLHDPTAPLAKMYAERFGWDQKVRKRN